MTAPSAKGRIAPGNSNIEEDLLGGYLKKAGHSKEQISRAIYLLRTEAHNPNRSLYDNNKAVYGYLYPAKWFTELKLPQEVQESLMQVV